MATKFIGRDPSVIVAPYSEEQPKTGPRAYCFTLRFEVQVDDELEFAEAFQNFYNLIGIAREMVEGRE